VGRPDFLLEPSGSLFAAPHHNCRLASHFSEEKIYIRHHPTLHLARFERQESQEPYQAGVRLFLQYAQAIILLKVALSAAS